MKSLKSLLEERVSLESEIEGLTNKETLTNEEETRLNTLVNDYEAKQNEIKSAEKRENTLKTIAISKSSGKKDNEETLNRSFSLLKAVSDLAQERQLSGAEAEMVAEGKKEFRGLGGSTGNLVLPYHYAQKRANVNENGTAGVDVLGFAEALQASSIARQLGVSFFNLTADGKFVIQSPTTVTWEGEVDANADGGVALSTASITPKRLATKVLLSRQLIAQHNLSVENAFIQDIGRAVAAELDYSMFNAAGGFTEHAGNGVTGQSNTNVSSLMGAMVEKLMMANVNLSNAKFAASAGLFAEIAAATQVSAVTPLLSGNRAYGYETLFTSQIADNGSAQEQIYFADWSSFIIGQWGGLDILVDPYSAADTGQIKLVLNSFFDGNQKRTTDFALGAFTGTDIS